jgi:CrcB protein
MKLLLGVGFCGSFTTFSTFSVDVMNMLSRGEMIKAGSYVIANNVGGIAAAACGMSVARKVFF